MAILIHCQCGTDFKTGLEKCPRCGEPVKRSKAYRVVLRSEGKKVTRIVPNLEVAKEIEAKLKVDIARGEYQLRRKKAPFLKDVWKKYLPWAKQNKEKSWFTDEFNYNTHIKPLLAEKRLDEISQFDIEKLIINMKSGKNEKQRVYKPATIKHQVTLLSILYHKAEEWGLYEGKNPCKGIKKVKLNNEITEFLSSDEVSRLVKTLDEWPDRMAASIIKFALCTGARRSEIFKLTWSDIDFERENYILRDPKGKSDQVLPLSAEAIRVLRDVPKKIESQYVFYGKDGQKRKCIGTAWKSIKKAAKLPSGFRFHGLRHHFASALVSSGVDLYTVQKLLTHKDASTTQRYAHLAERALRNAVSVSDSLLKSTGKLKKQRG